MFEWVKPSTVFVSVPPGPSLLTSSHFFSLFLWPHLQLTGRLFHRDVETLARSQHSYLGNFLFYWNKGDHRKKGYIMTLNSESKAKETRAIETRHRDVAAWWQTETSPATHFTPISKLLRRRRTLRTLAISLTTYFSFDTIVTREQWWHLTLHIT